MKSDFLIILAWPEGYVTASGSWYDKNWNPFMNKSGKYRVGHSALALVDSKTGRIFYFDFGRYHTPIGYGRVRDEQTDPDTKIETNAKIVNDQLSNIKEILIEISNNTAYHGEGKVYASIINQINFNKAFIYAKKWQNKGLVPYGPFIVKGTNCSRFVAQVARASEISMIKKIRYRFPFCITPSPKRNISIGNKDYYTVEENIFKKIEKSSIKSYFSSIESE